MKQYSIRKTAESGLLVLEECDILEVRANKGNALCPVELELRNRSGYRQEEGFRYDGRRKTVHIGLSLRQAHELIDQDRTAQGKEFCEACYDFGAGVDPEGCARCRVLLALHQAGQGDGRKVRIPLPAPRSHGLAIAFALLLLVYWWTLCRWSEACSELATVRRQTTAERAIFRAKYSQAALPSPPSRSP